MTRDQHLEFCKRCLNREFNPQLGIVCGLTKRIADFENNCDHFSKDESVKEEIVQQESIPAYQVVGKLPGDLKDKLRTQQDLVYAIVGGVSAAIVGALIWALITVSTKYQIGYMAIGVGLLVGFSVRYFGAGVDYIFGFIGGFFALIGCALGDLLAQVALIADAQSMSYFDVLTLLNLPLIGSIFEESFSGMDVVFYGIAGYEGYKFAFRDLTSQTINPSDPSKLEPLPFAKLRLPIVIILFVGLSTSFYFIQKGSVGVKTFYYDSGSKMHEGMMEYGVENGLWNYWWENGNQQQSGFFKNGKQDSVWQFYNEDGILYRRTSFRENIQHGDYAGFYSNGQISDKGNFSLGRQSGPWLFFYGDGAVSQKGSFKQDSPDGAWEFYYPNGQISTKGSFEKGDPIGLWFTWYENGSKNQEIEHNKNKVSRILNSWDSKGKQFVKDGNGIHKSFFSTGEIDETGLVINGNLTGLWKKYTIEDDLMEEGEYKNGIYYIRNSWTGGKSQVVNGEGVYEKYNDLGKLVETGKIAGGLRVGEWEVLSPVDETTIQKTNYVSGKINGQQHTYSQTGELYVEGNMINNERDGEWKWYNENGNLESSVTFINGLKEGTQLFFDIEGNLVRKEIYSNGILTESKIGKL